MHTQDTSKDKPGMYLIPDLHPIPAMIAFDTSAPTDLDPQYPRCPVCGNLDIDCLCEVQS